MVQFLSIIFFLGFLQFSLGFSKVTVFLCRFIYMCLRACLLSTRHSAYEVPINKSV